MPRRPFTAATQSPHRLVGLLLACVLSGCAWSGDVKTPLLLLPREGGRESGAAKSEDAAVRAVLAQGVERDKTGRMQSLWLRTLGATNPRRWHYPNLDELIERPVAVRPDFTPYLSDADPAVAANAAIALARLGDRAAVEALAAAVRAPRLPLTMRCAAIEGLGDLRDPTSRAAIDDLLNEYGLPATPAKGRYVAELHAELLYALAKHVEPDKHKAFLDALHSPAAEVQVAAIEAWRDGHSAQLPQEVLDLRGSGKIAVRLAVLQAVAAQNDPSAETSCAAALRDTDLKVRLEAIRGLGMIGSPAARAKLLELLKPHTSERERMAVVAALAACGARAEALQGLDDPSWRVRGETPAALIGWSEPAAIAAAQRLLDDRSAEVQHRLLLAIAEWPLPAAGPILLRAMESSAFITRRDAAAQLAGRWPPAAEFPVEAAPERRAAALAQLGQQFHASVAAAGAQAGNAAAAPPRTPIAEARVTAAETESLAAAITGDDRAAVNAFGPRLPAVLDALIRQRSPQLPEWLWHEALPRAGEVYQTLDALAEPDLAARRRASGALQQQAARAPLPPLALYRMEQRMALESDTIVWEQVLDTLANDGRPPVARLALLAIGHESAEVRRRACEYLAAFPAAEHVPALLPATRDGNQSVARAAIRALGRCDAPAACLAPLRALMASQSPAICLEAAVALARLGDASGVAGIERAAYSNDPTMQREAAEAMGEIGNPTFVGTLIRLLEGHVSVQNAALASLEHIAGFVAYSADEKTQLTTSARVERWQRWQRQAMAAETPRR